MNVIVFCGQTYLTPFLYGIVYFFDAWPFGIVLGIIAARVAAIRSTGDRKSAGETAVRSGLVVVALHFYGAHL